MGRKYQVISADGHLETSPDPWLKHVPAKYRERAPRLVRLEDGGEGWLVEGMTLVANGVNLTGGKPMMYTNVSYWNADGTSITGTGTPEQRLREQDFDGIDAEVLFPPIFAGRFFSKVSDRRIYLALIRAYNDFLAEYCSVAPDRLIGNGLIPMTGIEDALAELKYCKDIGLLGVSPIDFPNGSGRNIPEEDDRFWESALSLGMAIAPHVSIGDRAVPPNGASVLVTASGVPSQAIAIAHSAPSGPLWGIIQLIASGTFNRFPELRLYFAETQASWMPFALHQMDEAWLRRIHHYPDNGLTMRPSEYLVNHCMFGIVCDPLALKLQTPLPVENLMWGSDLPHSAGSFPDSRKWLAEIFDGVDDAVRRRVLVENPCAFYGLDVGSDITETPVEQQAVAV
jgi:predicted TIM-barrel fold metal-dependent hydrolase